MNQVDWVSWGRKESESQAHGTEEAQQTGAWAFKQMRVYAPPWLWNFRQAIYIL